jgi:hypothetical protein
MEHPFPAPGVQMITQEYLAASLEVRSRTDLTAAQLERLNADLADEHGLRCAQEWKSVSAQMRADQEAGSRSLSEPTPVSRSAYEPRPSPVDPEDDGDDEPARVGVHHEQAWEHYLEAERRELKMRKEGHLAKLLGSPLAEESAEELKRLAEDDRLKALEGLVALKTESGEIVYRPLEDLTPQDRRRRARAEGERVDWIVGRGKKLLGETRRPLKLPEGYRLDLASDPEAPALRRPDGTVAARFSLRGITQGAIEREALEDLLQRTGAMRTSENFYSTHFGE